MADNLLSIEDTVDNVLLIILDYNNVKIYDRSFAVWSTRDNLPIER